MYDGILAESIQLAGHGGEQVEAYFARPLGPGPFPGVVVIHHMPGYDASTKEITRTFAVNGYTAICPNLYWREAPARIRMTPPPRHAPPEACRTSGWWGT